MSVLVPVSEAEVGTPRRPQLLPIQGSVTILVIEDDERVLAVTRTILEKLGYRVLCARTGKEAVAAARRFEGDIDLAILDAILPDMDGQSVYQAIVAARSGLRVLVCSGHAIDGPPGVILGAGADGFLPKPFTAVELSGRLAGILGSG